MLDKKQNINYLNSDRYGKSLTQYYHDLSRFPVLSNDEEKELLIKIKQNGDASARSKFINSNLRLVWSIAENWYIEDGVPFEDLISYGNQGLIKAVDTYDFRFNTKFSTHAYYHINGSISDMIRKNHKLVKIPSSVSKDQKIIQTIKHEIGDKASIDDIYEYCRKNYIHLTKDDIRLAIVYQFYVVSTDEYNPFDKTYEDDLSNYIDKVFLNEELCKALEKHLNDNERYILIHYYGLNGNETKTLEQIGKDLGFSKERARQLRNLACEKIRRSSPQLKEYLFEK